MVKRVMCDCMVHDAVAGDSNLKQLIDQCRAAGHIVFKTTRVQLKELSQIPFHRDIGQATAIDAERIGTSVFVCGYSRCGEDRLAGSAIYAVFAAILKGNPKQHFDDAMIGATAFSDADILVTNDGDFGKKFKKLNTSVQVMSSGEFASYLGGLLTAN